MDNLVKVHGCPHPFRNTRIDSVVLPGATLAEIVEKGLDDMRVPAALRGYGHAYVGSRYVPKEEWGRTIPNAGEVVTYRIVPQGGGGGGGGGKNPLAMVLTIAVIAIASVVTFGVGSMLAGGSWAWGLGMAPGLTLGQGLIAAGAGLAITAAGMLAINALVPTRVPSASLPSYNTEQDSSTYSISGSNNSISKFGVVPALLGRHKVTPPQGADPYSQIKDNDQYVRQLFILGYSDIEIKGEYKVGETPFNSYSEAAMEYVAAATKDTEPKYFTYDVKEESLSVQLTSAGDWQYRTAKQDGNELSVDITFPRGLVYFNSSGEKEDRSVHVQLQYRYQDADEWTTFFDDHITARRSTMVRRTFTTEIVPGVAPQVRCRRITADTTSSQISDETWWATLRVVKNVRPLNFNKPLAIVSTLVKATGQLNGSMDEFNVVAQSVCLDWDKATGTWIKRATSNPASIFRYVLQHPGNVRAVADAQIDLEQLQYWHEFCESNGFEYNRVHDFQNSVFDVLRDVAAAGRAGVARPDGKWSVVIDEPRTSIVQHFTPRNSWGFKSTKVLPKLPHGWRVRFINEDTGYQSDELLVFDDGYSEANATEFEQLELPGVTNHAQAWKLGRHHLAVARLRPEEYEFYADMEHIVCTRGDLIRVTHDVPLWGLAAGRVKVVTGQTITVDEPCQMLVGKRYTIRFRTELGASVVREVMTVEGEQTTLVLIGEGDTPAVGDLFMFGELNNESVELVVKTVAPGENYTARLLCVDYAPAIFNAATGDLPQFDTHITVPYPLALKKPPVPVVANIRSDESVLQREASGALTSRICIDFTATGGTSVGDLTVQAQYREIGDDVWLTAPYVQASSGVLYISSVEESVTYELRVRAVAGGLYASEWTPTYPHTVVGKTSLPPDVGLFLREGNSLVWTYPNAPLDLDGFVLKWSTGVVASEEWDRLPKVQSVSLKGLRYTPSSLPAGPTTFLLKAVDVTGRESASPARLVTNATGVAMANVLAIESQGELGWPGDITGGFVSDSGLLANGVDTFWQADEDRFYPADNAVAFWAGQYTPLAYEAAHSVSEVDVGVRMRIDLDVEGVLAGALYAVDGQSYMWSPVDELFWSGSEMFWSDPGEREWLPMPPVVESVVPGSYLFRVALQGGAAQAAITKFDIITDVADVSEEVADFTVPAAGARLPLTKAYREIKTVRVTVQGDGNSAFTAVVVDKSTAGPLIRCLDKSGAFVDGFIDADVIGY